MTRGWTRSLLRFTALALIPLTAATCASRGAGPGRTHTAVPARTAALGPASLCAAAMRSGDESLLRLVDKRFALPTDYAPADLVTLPDRIVVPGRSGQRMRREAAAALATLVDAATGQDIELRARSTYRSYDDQVTTFQFWVVQLGADEARRESAEPGHSEHQLGTVADVLGRSTGWEFEASFGDTAEGKWLVAHASEHGFAISYPKDGEAITGYIYEPWHVRYIGPTCSRLWAGSGLVLSRFLEAAAASS
jgi:D-alanyl-D-alanine carboxypeptidase